MLPGVLADELPPGVVTAWQGWGVKPEPGDWLTIREFLLDVICAGNREHFDYLIGLLARRSPA